MCGSGDGKVARVKDTRETATKSNKLVSDQFNLSSQ